MLFIRHRVYEWKPLNYEVPIMWIILCEGDAIFVFRT